MLMGATQGHTCLCANMQRGGVEVESWVDMHTCTDACTHSNWSILFEKRDYLLLTMPNSHLSAR